MPGALRTGQSAGGALRTSHTSLAGSGRTGSRTSAVAPPPRPKTAAQEAASKRRRRAELAVINAEICACNAALHAQEEAARNADEDVFEAGYVPPIVVSHDKDDVDDDELPPSDNFDADKDNEIPIASSDPIDFDDSSDGVLVSSDVDLFVTPVKRVRKRTRAPADDGADVDGVAPNKGGKVTKGAMTPRTQCFACDLKSKVVLVTATQNQYPGALNREPHIDSIMAALVEESEDVGFADTYNRLKRMPEKFQTVMAWVLYARGGFVNQLAAVCRQQLGSLGIPGSMKPPQVADVITWLLKQEGWKFGGLDIVKREYNRSAPFGAPFFEAVARTLFMEGRKKQSGETFRHLIKIQQLPLVFMALTMTAIEHCLSEWRDGSLRRLDFKEDASGRYLYHLAGLEHVKGKAPSYIANLQSSLFKDMLIHTNKTFLLETAVSDTLGSLDFDALEKSVA